jgi:hypothetical protein
LMLIQKPPWRRRQVQSTPTCIEGALVHGQAAIRNLADDLALRGYGAMLYVSFPKLQLRFYRR